MRNRPAWGAANGAKAGLVIMAVNLIDNPINIIRQFGTRFANRLILRYQAGRAITNFGQLINGKSKNA